MEITAQTSTAISVGTATGASAAAGNPVSNGPGFYTTLNGMLVSGNSQADTDPASAATSLSALMGLIAPILMAAAQTDKSAATMTGVQINGLIQLLEQPQNEDGENPLLSNPDLQAWLAQLQSVLAALTPNPQQGAAHKGAAEGGSDPESQSNDPLGEALNPMLFIPLITATPITDNHGSEGRGSTVQTGIAQAEAVQMLKQLKEMVDQGKRDPQLQQTLKELPAVLVSAAASGSHLRKESERLSQLSLIAKPASNAEASETKDTVRVAANPLSKLEILAAKHSVSQLSAEQSATQDQPLFEPLTPIDSETVNGQQPVMTVQDWMKGIQTGHSMPKSPVLHMSAGTFTNDLTQFVVSSFSLATSADGLTEAKISLFPQHLGHVEVKLTMQNGMLVAQFMADSLSGKEMLESQIAQLRASLQSQGIQVEKLEVSQSQGFQSGTFQEGRQQQPGQSSKQNKSGSGNVASIEEDQPLDLPTNLNKTVDGNGSIDVTA